MNEFPLWLIPIIPFAGFLINLLLGHLDAKKGLVSLVGVGSIASSTVLSFVAVWQYIGSAEHAGGLPWINHCFTWISAGDIHVNAAFQLDALSAVMICFITFVATLIHIYSIGYMHGETDRAYARYFAYLNLFMFSMLMLALGANLVLLFVGWEGVGLCSYLLIGYYFEKDWAAKAGMKAFIVNRIGDLGFLLAIFATFQVFGTSEFAIFLPEAAVRGDQLGGAATLIALLLFVGAIGKSAQIPLYVWLPDAMAGPTPVSALIHAATMVTAGVYVVVRCNILFQLSPTASLVVAIIGGLTAVFAATMGLVANDIKKVLAYSTVSQLGYMFLAAGSGAYVAAIFHVVTHAFFKGCLFLGSGSVIHACHHEQDMRKMGGLKAKMPVTFWTYMLATLAIAGIPIWAGFFSKDEILAKVFEAGIVDRGHAGSIYYGLWGLAVVGAFMTAFYMMRSVRMTFLGSWRGSDEDWANVHESPFSMTLPLVVLALLATVGGFAGVPGHLIDKPELNKIHHFLEPITDMEHSKANFHEMVAAASMGAFSDPEPGEHEAATGDESHGDEAHSSHAISKNTELGLMGFSVLIAAAGLGLAWRWYDSDGEWAAPKRLAGNWPKVHRLLENKYWVDEAYDASVIQPLYKFSVFCWKVIDAIIDGLVNAAAFVAELTGDLLRFLQTGNVRNYALSLALGILALALLL